jgi:DNA-binding response OmpR family regulator
VRVLLVDDEAALLQLLGQYLTRNGHACITATTVAEAKAALCDASASQQQVEAVVIDLQLPDGSGEEIAELVAREHPGVRIIVATGYAYEPPRSLQGKVGILQKPFLPRTLLNVLVAG